MSPSLRLPIASLVVALLAACATRSADVAPLATSAAEFATWDCQRLDDEAEQVQRRAADVAWAVDDRAGGNIVALGLGLTVFWPALLAMRPDGLEAANLARLKGRHEALLLSARQKGCPAPGAELPPGRAAALPLSLGERLVYEDRWAGRAAPSMWSLRLRALRRSDFEFVVDEGAGTVQRQDPAGNVLAAPPGAFLWPHLLRPDLELGQVTGGDIQIDGDPLQRARLRGQVVAKGEQLLAGRRFDAIVVELFGDATNGDRSTRVDGVLVIDRSSGVLLRLDLSSANPAFALQRRLLRVDAAPR